MNLTRTHLADGACSTFLLKIDGCNHVDVMTTLASICEVDGYEWEIRLFYPCRFFSGDYRIALMLVFLSNAGENRVRAALSCRLVDPSGGIEPSAPMASVAASFQHPSDSSAIVGLMTANVARSSGYIKNESMTVECTITVFKDILVPSPNLPKHLGALLDSNVGADVTFSVSGESFAAHKNVLAARSPVFMAEFFGEMQEKRSDRVKIGEMEPSVFGAMLRFIYTDAVPELDKKMEAATAILAQHLLVAADRYGLDRLKVMCESRLGFAIDTGNAATMLVLAERHGCSQLKVKCVEFIAGGSRENLDRVMKTEGFNDLIVSCPSLFAELLVAAHERKN
jgi:speckle-type POZ protein